MFWISSEPSARGEEFHYDLGAVRPFETRASPIRLCRKRPFATGGQGRRPTSAAVYRIPCLILCRADVERVCQCRAPNAPGTQTCLKLRLLSDVDDYCLLVS